MLNDLSINKKTPRCVNFVDGEGIEDDELVVEWFPGNDSYSISIYTNGECNVGMSINGEISVYEIESLEDLGKWVQKIYEAVKSAKPSNFNKGE